VPKGHPIRRDVVCLKHSVVFVTFKGGGGESRGCPVCVGLIRAKVQKEMARRDRWRCGPARKIQDHQHPQAAE